MCVDAKPGKKSKTQFEVLETFPRCGYALLKCEPPVARTHQIRMRLHYAGFPVGGDELYGGKPLWLSRLKPNYRLKPGHEERPLLSRATLHAEGLPHPVTNELVTITAEWPKDLKVAVKYLRRFAM